MRQETRHRGIIISLLIISAVLITAGILRGEMTEIYHKGITVCLSCIGIG